MGSCFKPTKAGVTAQSMFDFSILDFRFSGRGMWLQGRAQLSKDSRSLTAHLSSLPISRLSPGLVRTQNIRSGQQPNLHFHQGAGLSLQTAHLHGKNRNSRHHMYMQICQPDSALKIAIYCVACILAQKTLSTYFMLI